MLEPPFNHALHRQAINRAYRLGQRRKVLIHTLVMKDSIEQRIWRLNQAKLGGSAAASLAGSISGDKSAKLAQSEIAKLFEENVEA